MAKPDYYALNQKGSAGPDVSLIQIWLNGVHKKYACVQTLTVDGKFGSLTESAVKNFQCIAGLKMDGKVGNNTWDSLYAYYADVEQPGEQYPGTAMRNGNRGATVKSAQMQLTSKGYNTNNDGIMGAATVRSVQNFQQAKGLSVDGVIGPDTWRVLYQ